MTGFGDMANAPPYPLEMQAREVIERMGSHYSGC